MRRAQLPLERAVRVILAMVSFVLLIVIVILLVNSFGSNASKQTCQVSISLNAGTDIKGLVKSPYDIVCPRKSITIYPDHAEEQHLKLLEEIGRKIPYTYLVANKTEDDRLIVTPEHDISSDPDIFSDQFERILMYELGDCWNTFFEGRFDWLDEESTWARVNNCVVCANIKLERSVNQEYTSLTDNFQEIPPYYNTDAKTYEEYLYSPEGVSNSAYCRDVALGFTDGRVRVQNGETYSVFFVRRSSKSILLLNHVTGWFDGKMCQSVMVAPEEDLPKYCDVIAN